MRNIKILIEYDGTNYSGWQVQPGKKTIQSILESAIEKFLGVKTSVIAAGRTDAGVHALNQVGNFTTASDYDEETVKQAINAQLPEDIYIKETIEVKFSFHSRFDATSRIYMYRISKGFSVFNRYFSWYCEYPLDILRMNKGCELLLGKKDFTSFAIAKSKKENMCMHVSKCNFQETNSEIIFEIEADRFLHKCVRTIIGTFVQLGRGKLEVQDIEKILLSKDRRKAGSTAPPQGLFLKEVKY